MAVGILAGMAGFWVMTIGGVVEGKFWPVMGPLSISDPVEYSDGVWKWQGVAEKRRDCTFVRVEWFIGRRDGRKALVAHEVKFTDPPQARGAGVIHWAGILVPLPPDAAKTDSHANAIHKCLDWGWEVVTPFYDPPEAK